MSQFVRHLGLDPNDANGRLMSAAAIGIIAVAALLLTPHFAKRERTRISGVVSLVWTGIVAVAALLEYVTWGFAGVPWKGSQEEYRIFYVLPTWCLVGIAILWGSNVLRWWLDWRGGVLDPGKGRGFPVMTRPKTISELIDDEVARDKVRRKHPDR